MEILQNDIVNWRVIFWIHLNNFSYYLNHQYDWCYTDISKANYVMTFLQQSAQYNKWSYYDVNVWQFDRRIVIYTIYFHSCRFKIIETPALRYWICVQVSYFLSLCLFTSALLTETDLVWVLKMKGFCVYWTFGRIFYMKHKPLSVISLTYIYPVLSFQTCLKRSIPPYFKHKVL